MAGFGQCAVRFERWAYRDRRSAGIGYAAVTVGGAIAVGALAGRIARAHPLLETTIIAAATWAVVGGESLAGEAAALHDALAHGDLTGARARIPHLCARDPEALDADDMVRAGCESVAENTSDAVVAPLFWGAVAGVPGLLGYRAINTLDAMVGYRSARYRNFGWAAARLDDLANVAPARLTASLTVLLAPLIGGSPAEAARAWLRDAGAHPSPNAGPVEATAAGALRIRLGGQTRYSYGVEYRPALGTGAPPTLPDLRRTVLLSRLLSAVSLLVAVLTAGLATQNRALP